MKSHTLHENCPTNGPYIETISTRIVGIFTYSPSNGGLISQNQRLTSEGFMTATRNLGIQGIEEIEPLDINGSAVFRARQSWPERDVVIKILDPTHRPLIPKRFDLRRRALTRFAELDGVVTVYEVGITPQGEQYLVMPYLSTGSLEDHLRHGPMPWQRSVELTAQASSIVANAHNMGLVLGDLKPSSILLADAATPLIAVYGMATRRARTARHGYSAPETTAGSSALPSADVYSLCLILASLLTGRAAVDGENPIDLLGELGAPAPRRVIEIVERGLSRAPVDRFSDAEALASALTGTISGPESDPGLAGVPDQNWDTAMSAAIDSILAGADPDGRRATSEALDSAAETGTPTTNDTPATNGTPVTAGASAPGDLAAASTKAVDAPTTARREVITSESGPPVDGSPGPVSVFELNRADEQIGAALEDPPPEGTEANEKLADNELSAAEGPELGALPPWLEPPAPQRTQPSGPPTSKLPRQGPPTNSAAVPPMPPGARATNHTITNHIIADQVVDTQGEVFFPTQPMDGQQATGVPAPTPEEATSAPAPEEATSAQATSAQATSTQAMPVIPALHLSTEAKASFPGGGPIIGDEKPPFRAVHRRQIEQSEQSRFRHLLEAVQTSWFARRRSAGSVVATVGFAGLAGIVAALAIQDYRQTSAPSTTISPTTSTIGQPAGPATFPSTSEPPTLSEPASTHVTEGTQGAVTATTSRSAAKSVTAPPALAPSTAESTAGSTPAISTQATAELASTTVSSTPTSNPSSTSKPTTTQTSAAKSTSTTAALKQSLIGRPSASRVRQTTARITFESSSCVTATFTYGPTGGSQKRIDGDSRCSRSHALLLGVVTEDLQPGTDYTVVITANDGQSTTNRTLSFTTLG